MKNIHILPTDKPSKIGRFVDTQELILRSEKDIPRGENVNIYITSDEEIKEGDWVIQINFEKTNIQLIQCITEFQVKIANDKNGSFTKNKIILTTDADLVKDGIQAIDDEFLEWFVKNPSCEEVEVIHGLFNPMGRQVDSMNLGQNHSQCVWKYKIIIPQKELSKDEIDREFIEEAFKSKEEPKQDYKKLSEEFTKTLNSIPNDVFLKYAEPKQETLEEAAKEFVLSHDFSKLTNPNHLANRCFQFGAKYQAEKMYSEEDMRKCWNAAYIDAMAIDEETYKPLFFEDFIKQFKNEDKQ